jgi:4-hydroxy-tetrahydrodipicolinate synthase
LYQRGIFSSALMRPPLLPLSQEEKDGVTAAIKMGKVGKIDLA